MEISRDTRKFRQIVFKLLLTSRERVLYRWARLKEPHFPKIRTWSRRMKRIAVLFLLFVSASVFAQEFRSTMAGMITDPTGAVVAKATVVVTNTDTGVKVQTVTDRTGSYTVPFLLPGKYSIRVTVSGFQAYLHDGITVQSGDKVQEDVTR